MILSFRDVREKVRSADLCLFDATKRHKHSLVSFDVREKDKSKEKKTKVENLGLKEKDLFSYFTGKTFLLRSFDWS